MICTHCRGDFPPAEFELKPKTNVPKRVCRDCVEYLRLAADLQQRKARIDERRRQAPVATGKPCPQCGAAMEKDYYASCRSCYFAQPARRPRRQRVSSAPNTPPAIPKTIRSTFLGEISNDRNNL